MYNDRIQPSGNLLSEDGERNDLKYSVEGTENRQSEYVFPVKRNTGKTYACYCTKEEYGNKINTVAEKNSYHCLLIISQKSLYRQNLKTVPKSSCSYFWKAESSDRLSG